MGINKNKKSILDLLDNVELELLQKDTEYAKEYLQEEGVNVEEEQNFAAQYMKKIQFRAKAVSNKKQDSLLLEKAFRQLKTAFAENAGRTKETLMALLRSKTPSVQYRKLDEWSDEEIRDVLSDVDLIELMENLESDD